jgi:hypothetical protein
MPRKYGVNENFDIIMKDILMLEPKLEKIKGHLTGIKLGRSFITHFLFVDDVLLFCDGSRREVNKLKKNLDFVIQP